MSYRCVRVKTEFLTHSFSEPVSQSDNHQLCDAIGDTTYATK